MHIFDTHCHYNLDPLYETWQSHWQKAQTEHVAGSIVVGTTLETSLLATNISNQTENLYSAVGIHPAYVQELMDTKLEENFFLDSKTSQKIVAIGETGLDYFRLNQTDSQTEQIKSYQKLALTEQCELARKYSLPVILHVRDQEIPESPTTDNAYWDVLEITVHFPDLQFILHCVSGPLAYVREMVTRGAFVSVAANITYPSAHHIRTLIANTPQNKLLLETDAPYLPPQSYRGQLCEPFMISQTALFLEQEMDINLAEVFDNTFSCFSRLPRLHKTN